MPSSSSRKERVRAQVNACDAFESVTGPALVLDAQQVVRGSTPGARSLLGLRGASTGQALTELVAGASPSSLRQLAQPSDVVVTTRDGARKVRLRAMPGSPDGQVILVRLEPSTEPEGPVRFHGMWTQSPNMRAMFRMIERVAADNETVLVRGETGTGKELVAHAIHALSARAKGPFRVLNCAALPANLLESELFGHARGAFTGALKDTQGHVQLAHRGTLFLDEVAELPLELQAKLLRVLETHSVVPVGAREPIPVDVRFVSATHRALRKEIEAGRFRADLMYRLRVIPIFLPPLREREDDIELLAHKLLEEMSPGRRRTIERISPAALDVLRGHDFPGNVRELRNVLSFAYAMGDGPVLIPQDLPPELLAPEAATEPSDNAHPEARRIQRALAASLGNRHEAAARLGISRITLWRRMRQYDLLTPDEP